MYKIGIDARLYGQTGVGVYLRNLLHYLEKIDGNSLLYYIYLMKDDYKSVEFKKNNFIKREAHYHWHSLSEQIGFAKLLYSDNLDLVHFTYFGYPIIYRKKFLATVHDMTPLVFKTGKASTRHNLIYQFKYMIFKFVLNSQLNNAVRIIAPTKSVKNELSRYYGQKIRNKTVSVYEGVNYELMATQDNPGLKQQFRKDFFYLCREFLSP